MASSGKFQLSGFLATSSCVAHHKADASELEKWLDAPSTTFIAAICSVKCGCHWEHGMRSTYSSMVLPGLISVSGCQYHPEPTTHPRWAQYRKHPDQQFQFQLSRASCRLAPEASVLPLQVPYKDRSDRYFLVFWNTVSLCGHGCPRTHYVDRVGLELLCRPLPPKCWGSKHVPLGPHLFYF